VLPQFTGDLDPCQYFDAVARRAKTHDALADPNNEFGGDTARYWLRVKAAKDASARAMDAAVKHVERERLLHPNTVTWHPHARCCWCGGRFWNALDVWLCSSPACTARQNAWSMWRPSTEPGHPPTAVYVPTPRAVDFFEQQLKTMRVLYGGAAGGAKSHTLRWGLYRYALAIPNFSGLLLRRTYKELDKTHLERMIRELPTIGGVFRTSDRSAVFPNGAKISAGHCETDSDVIAYLSTEYDVIVIDELVTFPEGPALEIMSRARTSNPSVHTALGGAKVWAATNPGGQNARWVKDLFVDREPDPETYPRYRADDYAFVSARLDDNPYLDQNYRSTLEQLREERRRQLLEGDWTAWDGRFFSEWRSTVDEQPWHVDDPIIPAECDWVGSLDWGFNAPGVFALWACLEDGHYHRAVELKFSQTPAPVVATQIWKLIKAMIPESARLRYIVADPSMWNKSGHGRGEAIAETLSRCRLPMRRGDNTRGANGWQQCHDLLRPAPDGRPWISVNPRCKYFLRTVPMLGQSPNDPDDLDTTGDDHAADDFRYFCNSRPSPTRRKAEQMPQQAIGRTLQDLRAKFA